MSSTPARAQQDPSIAVEASASPSTAGAAETVTYTIRVEGAALSAVTTPEPPATTGLALRRPTPSTERRISFVGGHLNRSVIFQWEYQPLQEGTARFQPVEVTIQGQTYTTDEIQVQIVAQAQRSNPSSSAPSPGPASPDPPSSSILEDQNLFIRADPETQQSYQNEQIPITYHLYFREGIQLRHSRLADAWDATGFWREELDVESRPLPRTTYVNGEPYQTIVLKRVAVFPTRPGSLRVDPLVIETQARASHRLQNRMDPFFSLRQHYESVKLASDPLSIQVDPLPSGAPAAFNGAVGAFRVHTSVDTRAVQVGGTVQLEVRLSGTGNIATLQPPAFNPPDPFEAYDPTVSTSVDRSGPRVHGTKTFTYVLVPRTSGRLTLPPVRFAYFDPEQRRYRTLQSNPITIQVSGTEAPIAAGTTGDGLPVDDIAAPMSEASEWVRTDAPPLHRTVWAYAALLAPLLLAAALIAYRRRVMHPASEPPSPDFTLQEELDEARRYLRAGKADPFYATLERAVLGFIGHRLDAAPSGLTRDHLEALLASHDVPERARHALYELLDVCDRVRFSPAHPSAEAMESALSRAQQLIDFLDTRLPT